MRKVVALLALIVLSLQAFASHIAGGELFYEYLGPGALPNTSSYLVTMRLLRECDSEGQDLNSELVRIGVYNATTRGYVTEATLQRQGNITSIKNTEGAIPCLINNVSVCYQIGIFTAKIQVANNDEGYILSWIRFSRQELTNIIDDPNPAQAVGATFTTQIPGKKDLPSGFNSSPQFVLKDTVIICANKSFTFDFSAVDKDGDSLFYRFGPAYNGGEAGDPNPEPPATLNLRDLPYAPPYTGTAPLGPDATINSATGLITGRAPATPGKYVVNVCVDERRNGKIINTHRKDIIIKVGNCDFAAADLPIKVLSCDGYTASFENESTSAGIEGYLWEFGDPKTDKDTSNLPLPSYTFPDSGRYKVKLTVYGHGGCVDTDSTLAYVYPGFKANFNAVGSCYQSPYQFNDLTTSVFGRVNYWLWNFGDGSTNADTSHLKNDNYQYPSSGKRTIALIVGDDKGCLDTVSKEVDVMNNPQIYLPFKDTVICSIDTLQLSATSDMPTVFSWAPNDHITRANTANPQVFPKTTTSYIVTIDDGKGCHNTDSLTVNVIDRVTVDLGPDLSICAKDTVFFNPVSNALYYAWSGADPGVSDAAIKTPFATPLATTVYHLKASTGSCVANDNITVKVTPLPVADAGAALPICYGSNVQLQPTITGSAFYWSPVDGLSNPAALSPVASPRTTTTYKLTVTDTLGCPKPGVDSVTVVVIPPVHAFAGNDTTLVINQPLQVNATGGTSYVWSPTIGVSNPNIPDPVITLTTPYDSIVYRVHVSTPEGCAADDDMVVKVFKTLPEIFIPSAFTPNGDGLNDVLKPLLAGMKQMNFFQVYNRWGQLVFSTKEQGRGWDGTLKGLDQQSGTYVYVIQAINYLGETITKKGTVVLLR